MSCTLLSPPRCLPALGLATLASLVTAAPTALAAPAASAVPAPVAPAPAAAPLVDGGTVRLNTFNGWTAFEVITEGDDVAGDGSPHVMPAIFDGAGAWMAAPHTLRLLVNHETGDASISEVDVDLAALRTAVANVLDTGSPGGVSFVRRARQAYDRWTGDGSASWTVTTNTSNTTFQRFCSGQSYTPDTFGPDRGFVDHIYLTGEEVSNGRLFALFCEQRDLYRLSGFTGSAPGGIGGMPADSWENAALLDTGETDHVVLLLSPDGGSQAMKLYVGEKGRDVNGDPAGTFLARNGLAYGSWYYLDGTLPALGATNAGSFDTTAAGALTAAKFEDVDTSPGAPTRAVLADQNAGVFTLDFDLVFSGGFDAGASSFTITRIADSVGGANSLNRPDNIDWTAPTTLGGSAYPDGLVFVNEDTGDGEVWQLEPDGSNPVLVAETTLNAESTGVFDLSGFLGYRPGSVLICNNQGVPSSMAVLVNPDATLDTAAWTDLGHALAGTNGPPLLEGTGTLVGGDPAELVLTDLRPNSFLYGCYGFAVLDAPFLGGTMVPDILAPSGNILTLFVGPGGALGLPFVWPTGVPSGVAFYVQFWVEDPGGPAGFSATNALRATAP